MKRLKLISTIVVAIVIIGAMVYVNFWVYDFYSPSVKWVKGALKAVSSGDANEPNQPGDVNEPNAPVDANAPADVNEPNKPADPNKAGEPNEPNEPGEPMEAVNLKDVEMKNLLPKLADWTGKIIIPDDEVMKVKISIYSPREVPRAEALELIYTALRAKGFVAEEIDDNTMRLRPIKDALLGSVPTIPDDQPLATIVNKSQIAQKFFKLKNYSPTQMSQLLMPLLGEHSYIAADENAGSLLVVDTVENLIRFERIINEFDVSGSEKTVEEFFAIEYGDPGEIVQALRKLLGQEDSRGRRKSQKGGAKPSNPKGKPAGKSTMIESVEIPIVLIPMPKYKQIIARGSADDIEQIGKWIDKLDRQDPAGLESETVSIDYADVREVAQQLNQALQRMPGTELTTSVLVQPLPRARQIMIFGRPKIRETVKKLIQEIDVPTGEVETKVFQLKHGDPDKIKENLEGLYEKEAGYSGSYRGGRWSSRRVDAKDTVRVISFPMMHQVTVIASPENMIKITEQINEWDIPINVDEVKPRIISLHNSDPVKLAELLSSLFTEDSGSGGRSFWEMYFGTGDDKKKIVGPLYGQLTFEPVPDTKKIIIISNIPEAYDVVEQLIADLDRQEMAEVPNVVTLNYADPEDLAERLNAIFNEPGQTAKIRRRESGLSEYSMDEEENNNGSNTDNTNNSANEYTPPWNQGRRRTDEMPISNVIGRIRFVPAPYNKAILVLAPPEFMQNIEDMIHQLDMPGKQVMLKAIVLRVGHDDMTSLGIQLATNPGAFGILEENAVRAVTSLTTGFERGSFTLSATSEISLLVDFLEKSTDAKVLNQQTLWTKDNEEALFFQGEIIAFTDKLSFATSENGRDAQEFSYDRVGMTLQVRPNITPENKVDMNIFMELSQLRPELVNEQRVRTNMETNTNAVVKDGETVVLGGILFQEDNLIERKIPFFGDIPLIGGLFRHEETKQANNELIVFITPYVVDTPANTSRETIEQIETAEEKLNAVLEDFEKAVEEQEED
ncbi:secretin N-terminal domain-containing protein [Planctomycetota bacterium]